MRKACRPRPVSRRLAGILCLAAALFLPALAQASASPAVEALAKAPLAFEPNLGQTDPQVRFLSRGSGYTLFLTSEEAVLVLLQGGGPVEKGRPLPAPRTSVLRMRPLDAAPAAQVEGLAPQAGRSHYLWSSGPERAIPDVPRFGRVAARGIYPGIDLVYYGNQERLEYDFVVAPGADPDRIRLGFEGAESLALDAEGNLRLRVPGGELVQPAPVIYQEVAGERRPVAGSFRLAGSAVGFEIASYDRSRPLVIDPQIVWASFLGGSSTDVALDVDTTLNGQAHVAGYTLSTDFPRHPATCPGDPDLGGFDAFVTKFNLDGTGVAWSTYLGGPGTQYATGIALDYNRNSHIVGVTFERNPSGLSDAFVAKLDAAGSGLFYNRIYGGSGADYAWDVAVNDSASVYVAGSTESTDLPVRNAAQPALGGGGDLFALSLNVYGTLMFLTYNGGALDEYANAIAVDGSGRLLIAGYAERVQDGPYDGLAVRLNSAGAQEKRLLFGGADTEYAKGIAVDAANNVFVAGWTYSGDFPTTDTAYRRTRLGTTDAFVVKLNSTWTDLAYSTYVGGTGNEEADDLVLDDNSRVYVAGRTGMPGDWNYVWTFRLNTGTNALSQLTFGGSQGGQYAYGMAMDQYGYVYLVGYTTAPDFPASDTAYQPDPGGGGDAFLAKIQF